MYPYIFIIIIIPSLQVSLALFEDVDDLFEELVAGVELLLQRVVGIVAVFADDDDTIDGEFAGAESEGVGDGFRYTGKL